MNAFLVTLLITATVFTLLLLLVYSISVNKLLIQKRIGSMSVFEKKDMVLIKRSRQRKNTSKIKFFKRLENDLSMSGILIRSSEFLLIWITLALLPSCAIFIFSGNIIFTLLFLFIGVFIPPFYVHHKKVKRVELFEQQLIDAIGIMSSCLKAGLTFQQALVSIASEMPDPISEEFSRVVKELKLGSTIETSLTRLSDKINSQNFMMIVSAILIQRQTGGNLSEILTNISGTIKERFKLKNEIKVLTATARTSGIVVGLMPVFIIIFFLLFNPSYVTMFFNSNLGITMVVAAIVMELIGFLVIRKIVNIKF